MTGLFDRLTKKVESPIADANRVDGGLSLPQKPVEDSPSQAVNSSDIPLGDDDPITFGVEKSSTDAILEMVGEDKEFAVKGVTSFPAAFTAAQLQADYNESLGFGAVSLLLRGCCRWQYRHCASLKGERAKMVFNALGSAKQEEFLLEKETKGLLKR